MIDDLWNSKWNDIFLKIYILTTILSVSGILFFWHEDQILRAQICCIGLLWSVFGLLINKVGKTNDYKTRKG